MSVSLGSTGWGCGRGDRVLPTAHAARLGSVPFLHLFNFSNEKKRERWQEVLRKPVLLSEPCMCGSPRVGPGASVGPPHLALGFGLLPLGGKEVLTKA